MAGRGRPNSEFFFFISDDAGYYYYATYQANGIANIQKSSIPVPIKSHPLNFEKFKLEFGTNDEYFSLVRSVSYTFEMTEDGADVMRYFDYTVLGYASKVYLTIVKWDGNILAAPAHYHLYYKGQFDLAQGKDRIKTGYKVNSIDNTAWGLISQNDSVQYRVQCNASNPKAIKVLYDGTTLQSKYIFQPIQTACDAFDVPRHMIIPIAPVSTEGDTVGIITNSQNFQMTEDMQVVKRDNPDQYFIKTQYARTIHLSGTFSFTWHANGFAGDNDYLHFFYFKSRDTEHTWYELPADRTLAQFTVPMDDVTHQYSFPISTDIDLADGESITLYVLHTTDIARDATFTPLASNLTVSITSKVSPTAVWCLRPLDVLQDLVFQATNGRFTINSDFFTVNNKTVVTCGNALRLQSNAYISSTIKDWFKSFDVQYYIALRSILGQIWCEEVKTVYSDALVITNLGEVIDVELSHATKFHTNRIDIGSPKQNYSHASGRLEFNTTNSFSSDEFNVKQVLSLISPYRTDPYGQEFIRLDYQQESTVDNAGDSDTFLVDITDELATGLTPIQNFANFQVNTAPLAPLIRYPFNNDTITNDKPTLRGVCPPATTVNIYVDGSLDGSTVSDASGNWIYDIVTSLSPYTQDIGGTVLNDGVHEINTTYTDLSAPFETVVVNIRTGVTATSFWSPSNGDYLYNNKPLLKGFGQTGDILTISVDGLVRGTATVDGSCRWFFQLPLPLYNFAPHTITAGTSSIVITVNSWTAIPLITSFDDGFQIVTDLPLIEGVGTPGTTVFLFANYYPNFPIGSTVVDANGNWSFQTVPVFKDGGIEPLTPFPNGDNIVSTDLDIKSVFVSVRGYKLDRPVYTSMNLPDDVFNTKRSPHMNMLARMPLWKSIWIQQPNKIIKFQTSDKNADFTRTDVNGVTILEKDDIRLAEYPEVLPLFHPRILDITTTVPYGFQQLMENFSAGGLIQVEHLGNIIWCLPVGTMSIEDVTKNVQKWSLLVSAKTPLFTLLALAKAGQIFNLVTGAIYRSDYNTLHFVKYNYTIPAQYTQPELYDDWFENRSTRWQHNPIYPYRQKFRNTDGVIKDQIVVNTVGNVALQMYRCSDTRLINTFTYTAVIPQPIPPPDFVREAIIDLSTVPHDQYYFVMVVDGVPVAISERIQIGDWPKTIRIEASSSIDKTGMFYSTGIKSIMRIEGLVGKLQPDNNQIVFTDEKAESQLLNGVAGRKRFILFGDASGLPDYIYLKCSAYLALNTLFVENVRYVITPDAKIAPIEEYEGYPLYAYKVEVLPFDMNNAALFGTGMGTLNGSVVVVVDAEAFGYGGGGLVNIEIKDE